MVAWKVVKVDLATQQLVPEYLFSANECLRKDCDKISVTLPTFIKRVRYGGYSSSGYMWRLFKAEEDDVVN